MIDLTANCIGLYKMDENEANTDVADSSGNGNDGIASVDTVDISSVNGKIGRCFELVGASTHYISYGTTRFNFESDEPWSISLWGECRVGLSAQIIGKATSAGTHKGYQVWYDGTAKKINFEMAYNYGFDEYMRCWTSDANLIDDGNLHHIIVTYSGSRTLAGVTMYIDNVVMTVANGKLSYVDDLLPVDSIQNAYDFRIASHSIGGNYWDGRMDCFYIFNKVLSVAEVSFLWNGGAGTESLVTFPVGSVFIERM